MLVRHLSPSSSLALSLSPPVQRMAYTACSFVPCQAFCHPEFFSLPRHPCTERGRRLNLYQSPCCFVGSSNLPKIGCPSGPLRTCRNRRKFPASSRDCGGVHTPPYLTVLLPHLFSTFRPFHFFGPPHAVGLKCGMPREAPSLAIIGAWLPACAVVPWPTTAPSWFM